MAFIVISLIKIAIVMGVFMTTLAYLQWIERKSSFAHSASRWASPRGASWSAATPGRHAEASDERRPDAVPCEPVLLPAGAGVSRSHSAFSPSLLCRLDRRSQSLRVRTQMQITDLNIGVLFVLANLVDGRLRDSARRLGSNNKYALLGGIAQFCSDDQLRAADGAGDRGAPAAVNTLSFRETGGRAGRLQLGFVPRGTFSGTVAAGFQFIIYLIAAFAETNRIPFDLPEAENEWWPVSHRIQQHEVRRFLHGRVRQHDHRQRHDDIAVPGRLAAAVPGAMGSIRARVIFAVAGAVACITDCIRRGVATAHAAGLWLIFSDMAAVFLIPWCRDAAAGVLVRGQNWLSAVRVYLDSRHVAPLPLRPVDGFRVEVSFPGALVEFAGNRVPGGLYSTEAWTSFSFCIFALIAVVCAHQRRGADASDLQRAVADRRDGLAGSPLLLLGAEFIAAAQVIVYAGAIMVLFVFVIMLLNAGAETRRAAVVMRGNCWACRCCWLRGAAGV